MEKKQVIGVRELKSGLSAYLRRVRQGQSLLITDRGQPVAELRPIGAESGVDATLAKLEAIGAITRGTGKPLRPFRPIKSRGGSAEAAVLEDRADRF
jgi:prevent-host-death family protein